ncbi:MAG: reverse transcriptase-like protein [Lachnospiraceae bacterium]|nr:reverse transcriptase-like protein [Lachnospiraceae bacterium]
MEIKIRSFLDRDENDDSVHIYVDGSYNKETEEYAYGMVVLNKDGSVEEFSDRFSDPELKSMWNVAGEIMGACAAMQYALDYKIPSITIFHDYEGISKWPLGEWKTKKEGTRAYVNFYNEARKTVSIKFIKVTGHSGDKYNDMADKLAREALGL